MDEQTTRSNPYAPPRAPVADAPVMDPRGAMPKTVSLAIGILWCYLAVAAVEAALFLREPLGALWRQGALAATYLAILGGQGWVIYQISLGKQWARVLALAWWILDAWLTL